MDERGVEGGEMFDGLKPEVDALLNAAASDLPSAHADGGLLHAMAEAVDVGGLASPSPTPRRNSMLGKVLTAKAFAVAGVLVLTGGVASAATGSLPDPAQDVASVAVNKVGLHIPKSDKAERKAERKAEKEHAENHGKDVSGVARDKSGDGEANHGTAVCTVASEGKCKTGESTDDDGDTAKTTNTTSVEQGKSDDHRRDAEHRKDAEHRQDGKDKGHHEETTTTSTSTTIDDDSGDE